MNPGGIRPAIVKKLGNFNPEWSTVRGRMILGLFLGCVDEVDSQIG